MAINDEKMQRCQDYMEALEEERRKIQVFQRELPFCLELVTQAIDACKQQLSTTEEYNLNVESEECSEQITCSEAPVLEEFIPINRPAPTEAADSSHDDSQQQQQKYSKKPKLNDNCKKSDWLRSVQLWNQTPDLLPQDSPRKVEVKTSGGGGAFHPFKKDTSTKNIDTTIAPPPPPPASTSSTAESGGGGNKKEEKCQRKSRRCWSPELHKRFLQALQQLGGSHLATPKQIRELMKVDGLTNDEVKSHLQKYRLHTRRPSSSAQNNNINTQSAPQFVVVGGIWVTPEYAAMTATSGEASGPGVYAPIASLPPTPAHKASEQSHSPATSSSTHHNLSD